MGRAEIINFTKCKVLPNPESSSLTDCDDNSATHVLAAAVYCQLERNYFDETHSRSDVAVLFHCNTSQLSKAITGVEYKSGPHIYKKKRKATTQATPTSQPPKKHPSPSSKVDTTSETEETLKEAVDIDPDSAKDTLSSASSDSLYNPFV